MIDMPKPVVITADSTCDLSKDLLERYDIRVVPLTITLGEDTFLDGSGFTPLEMYARYRQDGTLPKTSAVGVQEFIDFFSQFTREGFSVVHLDISSELSNSYNAACMAASELGGIHVVDTRMLSTGIGLLAIEGAECRDRGMGARDIAAHLRELSAKVQTSFVLDTLEFMWKGGRCTGVAALGANLLHLKPALEMKDGKLVGEVEESTVEEICSLVRELIPVEEIHHTLAGCTISTHCGPKTLGILFIEE